MKAQLILENGERFVGKMFGSQKDIAGEVIFVSGGVVGYQEMITDPAYAGQIVIMTFPVMGNYGINLEDVKENTEKMAAMIVREKCDEPSNFRCEMTLDDFLKKQDVVGLYGIDTRALTKTIRDNGVMKGVIVKGEPNEAEVQKLMSQLDNSDIIMRTTTKEEYIVNKGGTKKAAVIDMGSEDMIAGELAGKDYEVTVYPANVTAEKVLEGKYDVLFISDGPGDPANALGTVETVKNIIGKLPVCGVGMGHQIIGLSLGGKTEKLKFGHHGGNQPVKNVLNQDVYVTSQNHNYVVKDLPEGICQNLINVNDKTCEGILDEKLMVQSVQFQPEAAPGTLDIGFLFSGILGEER